ncbi:MAG TPA: hypothetical protein VJL78_09565 [Candidatus Nitrosocosmicus sp.]|nr:hypothetical protein [Candidatus Nitrosocosmicus sp.]
MKIKNERKLEQEYGLSTSKLISTSNSVDETYPAYVNFVSSLKSPTMKQGF